MRWLRALCALGLAFALAACANGAPQGATSQGAASQGAAQDTASPSMSATAMTTPAAATTVTQPRKIRMPPLSDPLPPVRYEHACKVDGDCADLERCKAAGCRCVKATCIAPRPAVDPVVDPAPSPPPQT